MPDSPSDNEQWERLAAIFAELLESEDPEAALAGIVDPDLRAEAEKLWRNHQSASDDGFLRETPGVTVLPVFLPGQLLCGRFRVERMLGSGGMGEVYLAADEKVGGRVALKTMARMLAPVESMRHRFLAEVQTARRVTHRNICRIHDWFEDGETAFFTMEYLEGRTLDSVLSERTPSAIEARDWLLGIAEGLGAAHGGGILHGDLKPGNVMITAGPNPRAVVMDFGLARVLEEEAAASGDRNYSLRGGTAEYMAPEVAAGGPPSIASDLFAFGKIAAKLTPEARWWKAYVQASPEARPKTLEPAIRALSPGLTRRYLAIGGLMAGSAIAARWVFGGGGQGADPLLAGGTVLVNGIRADEELTSAARAIRMLFVLALRQSPRLRSPADQDLLPALRGLREDARLPAEGEVLAQLAERMRASHWVESTLRRASGRFSWDLSVRRKSDGAVVLAQSLSQPSVASVAEGAALWLRRAAGESDESLRKNPVSAVSFTSKVPEALDRYAEALEHIAVADLGLATPLLREAIRLDPEFAQAHSLLGGCLNSYRLWMEAINSAETAMRLAARLPEQEKSFIATGYYKMLEDQPRMVEEARKSVSWQPLEARSHRYLADVLCRTGRAQDAIDPIRRAVELSPFELVNWGELVVNLCEANRFEEALQAVQESRRFIKTALPRGQGLAHLGLEQYDEALRCFANLPPTSGRALNGAKFLSGAVEAALVGWATDRVRARGENQAVDEHEFGEFLGAGYWLTDRPALARQAMASLPDLALCPPHARRFQAAAFWASRMDDPAGVERAATAIATIRSRWSHGYPTAMQAYVDAVRARMNRDFGRAEQLLMEALGSAWSVLLLAEVAEVLEETGKLDAADEHWEKFEGRKGTILKLWFPGYLLYAWRGRMRLARKRNDRAQAVRCAQKIVDHWGRTMAQVAIVQEARVVLAG